MLRSIWSVVRKVVVMLFALGLFLVVSYLLVRLVGVIQRPSRTALERPLYQAVTYYREVYESPRPLVMHFVEIDRTDPAVQFLVTPRSAAVDSGFDYAAQRTTTFLSENGLQVAINGDYFSPFYSLLPFVYYPKEGEFVSVNALTISDSKIVADPDFGHPALCIQPDRLSFEEDPCPLGTVQAIGGNPIFLRDGVLVTDVIDRRHYMRNPQPRTVIALDEDGDTVWLIIVDGRQNGYSEGIGLPELVPFLLDRGITDALALDGGGSATLVVEENGEPRILNSPVHVRMPFWERPVANHLGLYAQPLAETYSAD